MDAKTARTITNSVRQEKNKFWEVLAQIHAQIKKNAEDGNDSFCFQVPEEVTSGYRDVIISSLMSDQFTVACHDDFTIEISW